MLLIKAQDNLIWNMDDISRFYKIHSEKEQTVSIKIVRKSSYKYTLAEYPISKMDFVSDLFDKMIIFLAENKRGLFILP